MISPTGLGIRSDGAGDGRFGAPRGDHEHKGLDFLAQPGQPVVMPIAVGRGRRLAYPYHYEGDYCGIEVEGYARGVGGVIMKMFYMIPFQVDVEILEGSLIGWAQDISKKYGEPMRPHIHLEIRKNGVLIDPETLLERRFV